MVGPSKPGHQELQEETVRCSPASVLLSPSTVMFLVLWLRSPTNSPSLPTPTFLFRLPLTKDCSFRSQESALEGGKQLPRLRTVLRPFLHSAVPTCIFFSCFSVDGCASSQSLESPHLGSSFPCTSLAYLSSNMHAKLLCHLNCHC